MDRRTTLAALAALSCWPLALHAARADGAPPRLGVLALGSAQGFRERARVLRAALAERGYVEGRTLRYEGRFADGDLARLPALARELVAMDLDVVVADSTDASLALREAGVKPPVVFAAADDPVSSRLVRSMEAPGTGFTGLTMWDAERAHESVKLLAKLLRKGSVVGVLLNPGNANYRKMRSRVRLAAVQERLEPAYIDANNAREIDAALSAAALDRERAVGVVVMSDTLFYEERARIVKLLAKSRRPAIHPQDEYVHAGGLMSFGPELEENYERAANFVDRILRGAKAAELPIEHPGNYRLVVNRAAARSLKLAMPRDLLEQAHRVVG